MPMITFAAINVGASLVELNVYEMSRRYGVRELDQARYFLELGSDIYSIGKITFEMMNELCEVLNRFNMKMEEYLVEDYVAYGSSVLREASNGDLILDQIKQRTGLDVRVVSNAQERFLTLKSVAYKMPNFETLIEEGAAIVDLGAGSLQVSIYEKACLILTQNIRLGTLRIREILSSLEGRAENFIHVMQDYIGNEIQTFKSLKFEDKNIKHVIVIGEEFSSIINYVSTAKSREFLTIEQFNKVYAKLLRSTPALICEKYSIPYEMATLVVPSSIILKGIFDETTAHILWETQAGFPDGIALDYLERHERFQTTHDYAKDILSLARSIAQKYESNREHSEHVEYLALQIFDAVKRASGLGPRDRLLLQLACILHDCGTYINMTGSTLHSCHIIRSTEIIGLSRAEKEVIAQSVLYHSGLTIPRYDQTDNSLDYHEYMTLVKLCSILRLANGLDQSHRQKIETVRTTVRNEQLRIVAETMYDITLEQGLMESKANLFEDVFGVRPVLVKKIKQ